MLKQLKTFTTNMIAGANIATGIIMWLVGFSDYANPATHPYIATAGLVFPVLLAINLAFLVFWLVFKWKMAVIPIAAYAAAIVPIRIYMPINPASEPPQGAIKVLSYNVKNYSGLPGHDKPYDDMVDYISRSKADIVCFQEDVDGSGKMKPRMDSLYAHTDTTYVGDEARHSNALGIYTRFPILRKERIEYESTGNGSVAYYLRIGRDTVLVINNHFESNHLDPDERQRYKDMLKGEMAQDTARAESKKLIKKLGDAARIRARQTDAVYAYIKSHANYPTILCGDFNDTPISYTRRMMAKDLTDCYVATGRGIGLSYNQKGFYVRIDNIMCSSHFKPFGCKVDSKIKASDHYPIYCWLKMK